MFSFLVGPLLGDLAQGEAVADDELTVPQNLRFPAVAVAVKRCSQQIDVLVPEGPGPIR